MISTGAQWAAIGLLGWVAVYDARHFRIRNAEVLIMLALYVLAQGALLFPTFLGDLLAGGLLFGIGFVMWLLRGLGAGDVKLMLPLGMMLGVSGLLPFAVLLMVLSVLLYLLIVIARACRAERGLWGWFARRKTEGRIPYGVILALSAIPVIYIQSTLNI
ncbi:prepilin peptidase [Salipiger sp. PrR002]|uniref:prepilin peptidase n=1 Tax=Salipiger sp. PrR002 TaxID=2706489 RepID=UPI0013B987CA|nr:A24 family peptidase [Salipiger sp. PrR002]NDW01118.1 prepilin peptidase [Salipiger sp. PrR002]NDW57921.1 prepilin peptidase [Salipiger sp. PrR004]